MMVGGVYTSPQNLAQVLKQHNVGREKAQELTDGQYRDFQSQSLSTARSMDMVSVRPNCSR